MAKQKSIIKLQGTLDDVTFYQRKGISYARTKGSLDRERILSDPNFKRTRENNNEFKGASRIAGEFRFSLSSLITQLGGSTVMGRLLGVMRRVISADTGERGKRAFLVAPNQRKLLGFEFNEENSFRSVFQAMYNPPVVDANRSVVSWTLPAFNVETELKTPGGATHFQFVMATIVFTDFEFDEETKEYQSVDPELLLKRSVAYSDQFAADVPFGQAVLLTNDLELTDPLPETAIVVTAIGVLFFQEVGGQMYSLNSEQALRVVHVA